MTNARQANQARRELDRRFRDADTSWLRPGPHRGWVRAVRTALGMSQAALGERLGITQPSVLQLEQAEISGGITIAKLGEVARALDCALVYALVPNTSLEDTVMREARRIATERLGYVSSTMALEDQSVDRERQDAQLADVARELAASGAVWTTLRAKRATGR